jgi:GH25 family lysozyme M1 (1,4-beta-N-acetylmuramidase)
MPTTSGRVPRRTLALTSLLVTAAMAASLATMKPDTASVAAAGDASPAPSGASWAHTASGKIIQVSPTHYLTPVHPETLTHPDADDMGSSAAGQTQPAAATAARQAPATMARQALAAAPAAIVPKGPNGIDVSSNQKPITWAKVAPHVDFVYAKATEGTYYTNPEFNNQYEGPYDYGVIRGAYHFAIPNNSSGTAQADYFVAHGGAWSSDGKTLPGALDIEYNPYGAECYGLSASQMVNWVKNFVTEYAAKTHAFPVIYSTTNWWRTCTGNSAAFAGDDPFWVANYGASTGGTLPKGWDYYSFWQYSDAGPQPGDQDVFNGAYADLRTLASSG